MKKILILFQSLILMSILSGTAFAAPSCSKWMPQPDGSQWRLCVGDDGRQYCESAKGGQISRVKCS